MFTSSLSHKHTFDFSKAQPNEAKLFYKMPLASFIRIYKFKHAFQFSSSYLS